MRAVLLTDEEWTVVLEALGYVVDVYYITDPNDRFLKLQEKLKRLLTCEKPVSDRFIG